MFIATLLTIAKTWRQSKHPLTEEWINKMSYIPTMEYYSAIKKNSWGNVFTSFPCAPIPFPPPASKTWSKNADFVIPPPVTCFCEQPMLGPRAKRPDHQTCPSSF